MFDAAVMERFWAKVEKTEGCWNWTAAKAGGGYGNFCIRRGGRRKNYYAHRVSWEAANGPIPKGLYIDHLCRNRRCVNPNHLEPVTPRENQIRGHGEAGKHHAQTECANGHAFTSENTYIWQPGKWPQRRCRTCDRENARRYRERRRSAA